MSEIKNASTRVLILATPEQLISINIQDTFITNRTARVNGFFSFGEERIVKCLIRSATKDNYSDEYHIPLKWVEMISLD